MNSTKQNGFTLIELVIVLVLLGILVAVALPKYKSTSGDAAQTSGTVAADDVKAAYATAKDHAKGYPTTAQVISSMKGPNTLIYTEGTGFVIDLKGSVSSSVTIPTTTSAASDCAHAVANGATDQYVCSLGTPVVAH